MNSLSTQKQQKTPSQSKLTIIKHTAGIDIGKTELVATYMVMLSDQRQVKRGQKKFKNTAKGVQVFLDWLKKQNKKAGELICPIVMEATGVYYENLAYFLYKKDYQVHVLLPNQTKAYGKSLNVKTKNDSVDSITLAKMGIERSNLRIWKPASPQMRTLQKLTRHRARLVQEKTRIKNHLSAEKSSFKPNQIVIKQLTQQIKQLEKMLKRLELTIRIEVEKDPELLRKIENIEVLKGLAFTTIVTIIAETNGFELFKNIRQLISYSGYDVVQNESGSFKGKTRISKKGNKHIRRALHMPSLSVVKWNPDSPFEQLYKRVYERTNIKLKGYIAVQRKMLCIIYTLFKNDQSYDADFHRKDKSQEKKLAVT